MEGALPTWVWIAAILLALFAVGLGLLLRLRAGPAPPS